MVLELGTDFFGLDGDDLLEVGFAEVQTFPTQVRVLRRRAKDVLGAVLGLAFDAVQHPLQHAHVVAEAGPDEVALVVGAEPVDVEDRQDLGALGLQPLAQVEPVLEVVAHVVAAEGQHGERIAAHHALFAAGGCGGLRAHGGGQVDAFGPAADLGDQRDGVGAAAAEDEGIQRHAGRIIPGRIDSRVVGGGHGEARVGVGCLAAVLAVGRGPVVALPVDQVCRRLAQAFPPHITVVGQGDVGEQHVLVQCCHAVGVALGVGTRGHAEVAGFGVDGQQAAVGVGLDPGNVIAHRGDFPALEALGRDQHGEVGLAAGRREGGCHVVLLAFGRGDAQDEHVLGQPAGLAVACCGMTHRRGDAQRQALLAQQGVAAVAGTVGPDLAGFREVDDVLLGVAGPGNFLDALKQRHADAVNGRHEGTVSTQHVPHGLAHAGHDAHVGNHIGRVGQLDADLRDLATQRAHGEGHDIHGAALHAALEELLERGAHLGRFNPVVGRAGVDFLLAADEGAVFDPGHVGRVGAGEERAGALGGVELDERAAIDHLAAQLVELFLAAIDPDHLGGLGQLDDLSNPIDDAGMPRFRRDIADIDCR